jgi:ribosomal protein S18 acetylase RimI-like enzyme
MNSEQGIHIRRATIADINAIVELSANLFQDDAGKRDAFMDLDWPLKEGKQYYSGIVSGANSLCLVAEASEKLVGFLTGYIRRDSSMRPVRVAELESMFVKQSYRKQSVGFRLAESFLDWCRSKGARRVSVTAYWANDGAIAFYKRLGFEPRELTLELGIDQA